MTKLKSESVLDEKPVKITLELPADLDRDLRVPRKGRERRPWSAASLPCLGSPERGSSDRRHLIPMAPPAYNSV